jgi:acyl transferase domain-containing protein
VQLVGGLETLYGEGVRVFAEVGPKKVLASFAEDCLGERGDVVTLATNNPKKGPEASFGAALAYLYSVGRGRARAAASRLLPGSSRGPAQALRSRCARRPHPFASRRALLPSPRRPRTASTSGKTDT